MDHYHHFQEIALKTKKKIEATKRRASVLLRLQGKMIETSVFFPEKCQNSVIMESLVWIVKAHLRLRGLDATQFDSATAICGEQSVTLYADEYLKIRKKHVEEINLLHITNSPAVV